MKTLILISFISLLFSSCGNTAKTTSLQVIEDAKDSEIAETIEIPVQLYSQEPVRFPSLDSITIFGILHRIENPTKTPPFIVLCHQARYNKTEYREITFKLNELGFDCLSIDQRSGGKLFDIPNYTHNIAVNKGLPTDYLDAEQDIIAAIDYAYNLTSERIILWGSSYSSALALHIGVDNEKLKAVIAFSPGDYFGNKKPELKNIMKEYKLPYFITSSRDEGKAITAFLSENKMDEKHIQFIPQEKGKHGSKALWRDNENNQEYWIAIKQFLANF